MPFEPAGCNAASPHLIADGARPGIRKDGADKRGGFRDAGGPMGWVAQPIG